MISQDLTFVTHSWRKQSLEKTAHSKQGVVLVIWGAKESTVLEDKDAARTCEILIEKKNNKK